MASSVLPPPRTGAVAAFVTVSALDAAMAGRPARAWQPRRWLTKPLLMPLLLRSGQPQPGALTVAQAASWAGDVALMRDDDDRWFRCGVASFAVTHVAYTVALRPSVRLDTQGRRRAAVVAAVSAVSALSLRRDAARTRPDLAPAVGVYGLVIGTMAATTAAVPVDRPGGSSLRAGALLFLASDSLIGATTFTTPDASRRWESVVMATYTAGQLLLSRGIRSFPA